MSARLANFTDLPILDGDTTPLTFGAKGDFAASTGAAVAASSTAFSNSLVTFVAGDVGKAIVIPGAGANGGTLTTTLAAVAGLNATLALAASAVCPGLYLTSAAVATAQSGAGSYAPGDTIALTGGTSAIPASLTVGATKVMAATIVAGGSGGTTGTQTVFGTTGTGLKFQASVTVTAGAITAVGSISTAGSYSVNPTDITIEPVVGAGLVGATLALTMGVSSASATVPGSYSVAPTNPVAQASTSGVGTGATFTLTFTTSGAWSYGTDNTAAVAAFTVPVVVPRGQYYYTNTPITSMNLMTKGAGALKDNAQRSLSPNLVGQTSAPASLGSTGFISSAFTGDLSRLLYPSAKFVSGATTLEQPSSGYVIHPENSIGYDYLYNTSGYNSSTGVGGGRTALAARYFALTQAGQGDMFAMYVVATVSGAKAGATSFLANPAVSFLTGSCNAASDGVYLNPIEIDISDNSYDCAGINFVANASRKKDVGALGAVWYCFRSQSVGTRPIDAHFSAFGAAKMGIDLTGITTNTSGVWQNAAAVLNGNDRIYFNGTAGTSPLYATTAGSTYLFYSTSNTGVQLVVNGGAAYLFTSSSAFIYSSTITLAQNSNNKLSVLGASTGSAPSISITASSDTNQDFKIAALGTGKIQFNNAGCFSANGAVATTMTSVGPTGANATVQEWLTIKNASGTVRYIPCY